MIQILPHSGSLKAKLSGALKKRHPFQEFKHVIDLSGEYREKWFAFKSKRLEDHVQSEFDRALAENH